MGGIPFQGSSGNVGDITSLGEIKTAPSRTNIGYIDVCMEKDPGKITGTPYFKQADSDDDYRLRAALDTFIDAETFNYTAQNTAKHTYSNTTMTAAWAAGFLTTNSGVITTLNTGLKFSSYRTFALYGPSDLWIELSAAFTGTWLATNTTIDFGAFIPGAANPYAPTDGCYFRANATGLYAVTNYNGTETVVGPILSTFGGANWAPASGAMHKFSIGINWRGVEFYIDDVLVADINPPTLDGTNMSAGAVPLAIRHAIGGTAASAALSLNVADYTISYSGIPLIKEWSQVCAGMGLAGYQGTSGHTMGSTAAIVNSTVPTAGAGSNTTALVTGLGGDGQMNAIVGAATDLIATSFLNPAGTPTSTGRVLYITGVTISAINYGATSVPVTALRWKLAFGHTAVSLATTESANTKAPRFISLGAMTLGATAAVGVAYGNGNPLSAQFLTPIAVNPGEYIASVVQQISGAATTSQTILFSVQFDAYWE